MLRLPAPASHIQQILLAGAMIKAKVGYDANTRSHLSGACCLLWLFIVLFFGLLVFLRVQIVVLVGQLVPSRLQKPFVLMALGLARRFGLCFFVSAMSLVRDAAKKMGRLTLSIAPGS